MSMELLEVEIMMKNITRKVCGWNCVNIIICHEEDSSDAKISGSHGGIWTTADGRCDGGGNKSIEKNQPGGKW